MSNPKDKYRGLVKKVKRQIGSIELSDSEKIVATLIGDEKLDLRVFVKIDNYTRATRRGFIFNLLDISNPFFKFDNWTEFKSLIQKIDKVYEEL